VPFELMGRGQIVGCRSAQKQSRGCRILPHHLGLEPIQICSGWDGSQRKLLASLSVLSQWLVILPEKMSQG
jgi:hypothetical protein